MLVMTYRRREKQDSTSSLCSKEFSESSHIRTCVYIEEPTACAKLCANPIL